MPIELASIESIEFWALNLYNWIFSAIAHRVLVAEFLRSFRCNPAAKKSSRTAWKRETNLIMWLFRGGKHFGSFATVPQFMAITQQNTWEHNLELFEFRVVRSGSPLPLGNFSNKANAHTELPVFSMPLPHFFQIVESVVFSRLMC